MRTSRTASVFPDVSPLRQDALRDRLQKCAAPVASVAASASRFAHASMRTIPVRASCAITGTSPSASNATAASSGRGVDATASTLSRTGIPRARK